ncbi:MAG: transglutaminase-like domain-containing protein [Bacteroidales bacterium]|nr:transglutaminase-like domain-containing protein [Bacteroidales bacterium]
MNKQGEEIKALISLLDDPDASVYDPVLNRLAELGQPAIEMLEHNWGRSSNSTMQKRIEDVISIIHQKNTLRDFKNWSDCRGEQLLYGLFLMAKTRYPSLDINELESKIETLRSEIWLELNEHLTALEKVNVINHFLFRVHHFSHLGGEVLSRRMYYINNMLETQKGHPALLASMYVEIAERLDLPIYIINAPGNFILCYKDPAYLEDPDGILFYINPAAEGQVLGRQDIENYLKKQNIPVTRELMTPASKIDVIRQLLAGLQNIIEIKGNYEESDYLGEIIRLLDKHSQY